MHFGRSGCTGLRAARNAKLIASAMTALICGTVPALAIDPAINEVYTQLSISPPTTASVVVCHGFGCRFRTAVGLGPGDRAKLTQMFASAKKTPEAERKAIAAATKWFDRRVGPEAGTTRRVAYAGVRSEQGPEQMDCIDMSRNNTSLMLILDSDGPSEAPQGRSSQGTGHAVRSLAARHRGAERNRQWPAMGGRQLDPQIWRRPRRHAARGVAEAGLLSGLHRCCRDRRSRPRPIPRQSGRLRTPRLSAWRTFHAGRTNQIASVAPETFSEFSISICIH